MSVLEQTKTETERTDVGCWSKKQKGGTVSTQIWTYADLMYA